MQEVFDRITSAKLKLHPAKCDFCAHSVNYLGHTLSSVGVRPLESKQVKLQDWPKPTNQKQLRQFLGFCNYYKRFVCFYSRRFLCLYELLQKDVPFLWTEAADKAFCDVRDALVNAPLLHHPDFQKDFIVSCDASTYAIGYALSQLDSKNKEVPICISGKSLSKHQMHYSVTELEALALVCAVREFHPYLANRRFVVLTDHLSLIFLQSMRYSPGKLGRWSILLQGYNYEVKYKPGNKHTNVDSISRLENYPEPDPIDPNDEFLSDTVFMRPITHSQICAVDLVHGDPVNSPEQEVENDEETLDTTQPPVEEEIVEPEIEFSELSDLQRQCPDSKDIYSYLEDNSLPDDNALARRILLQAENYTLIDGILYHLYHPRRKNQKEAEPVTKQLVIPRSLRKEILVSFHDRLCHAGVDRLYATIRRRYYFVRLYTDCCECVASCTECQRSKRPIHPTLAKLHPLPVPDEVGQRWHVDLIGPLSPVTRDGHRHIVLLTESSTGWPEAFAVNTAEAHVVAKVLYENVFTRFGAPRTLLSDRGTIFLSALISSLADLFSVEQIYTTAQHQQTNGKNERRNQIIYQAIRTYCENKAEWNEILPALLMAYRATVSVSVSQYSPFFLMFGREMNIGLKDVLVPKTTGKITADQYIAQLLPKLELTRKIAKENIEKEQELYKQRYDKSARPIIYSPGTNVWLHQPSSKPGISKKLVASWTGPYYITIAGPRDNYYLRRCSDNKPHATAVHNNRLKLFNDDRDGLMTRWSTQPEVGRPDVQVSNDNSLNNDPVDASQDPQTNIQIPTPVVGDSSQPQVSEWQEIEKLLSCKIIDGKKHYQVLWLDHNIPVSFEPEDNVPEQLKREFHISRTRCGRSRRTPLRYQ